MADRRPAVRAPEVAWRRLGELLQLRRGELGHRRRPSFTRDRDINIRLVTDIENCYRPNTFLNPTLRQIAQAYQVTYDSLIAVLAGKADELTPASPAAAPRLLPSSPMDDAPYEGAVRPGAVPIWESLDRLAARGVTDPSAADLGLSGRDAEVWDGSAGTMSQADRGWLVADMRLRREARAANPGAAGTGALVRGNAAGRAGLSYATRVSPCAVHVHRIGHTQGLSPCETRPLPLRSARAWRRDDGRTCARKRG
jgi:hypothetical protein